MAPFRGCLLSAAFLRLSVGIKLSGAGRNATEQGAGEEDGHASVRPAKLKAFEGAFKTLMDRINELVPGIVAADSLDLPELGLVPDTTEIKGPCKFTIDGGIHFHSLSGFENIVVVDAKPRKVTHDPGNSSVTIVKGYLRFGLIKIGKVVQPLSFQADGKANIRCPRRGVPYSVKMPFKSQVKSTRLVATAEVAIRMQEGRSNEVLFQSVALPRMRTTRADCTVGERSPAGDLELPDKSNLPANVKRLCWKATSGNGVQPALETVFVELGHLLQEHF